jgi:hypothetical protein
MLVKRPLFLISMIELARAQGLNANARVEGGRRLGVGTDGFEIQAGVAGTPAGAPVDALKSGLTSR